MIELDKKIQEHTSRLQQLTQCYNLLYFTVLPIYILGYVHGTILYNHYFKLTFRYLGSNGRRLQEKKTTFLKYMI